MNYNYLKILTMKFLFATLFCIATCLVSNAQTEDLLGSWDIIEFGMVTDENSNLTGEDQLKENGMVWSLFFMEDGKFKQTSNMRSGTLESHEGIWKTSVETLSLELQLNDQTIKLDYKFKLTDNILALNRSNPMGTMMVVTKFRKQ